MRARVAILVLLALSGLVHAAPTGAQVVFLSTPLLGMGFSPGSVAPIADGVPIYAPGDQLWVESYYNTAVIIEITNTNGTIIADDILLPNSSALIYTFSFSDKGGSWELLVSAIGSAGVTSVTNFSFVGSQSVQPSMTGYRLAGDADLEMNFSLTAPGAYDIGACLVGSAAPSTIAVPLPSTIGSGKIGLVREGDQVITDLNGKVSVPFTFWAELHYDYSYSSGANSTLITRDQVVATTSPLDIPTSFSGATTWLQDELGLRTGRFSMWAFFQSAQGLTVYQTPILIPDSNTWLSLGGCIAAASSLAPTFSLSAPLSQPTSAWPREIYTMYELDGVEMFSATTIPIAPAAIHVTASPWNETFTNPQLSVVGSVGEPVRGSSVVNSTIYLIIDQYPFEVLVGVSQSGIGTVDVSQPFSIYNLTVGSGKVVVGTEAGGKPLSNVDIILSEGGSAVASASSVDGEATFYVLPGNYTVAGYYGNSTSNGLVDARDGVQSDITLSFAESGQQSTSIIITYLLACTASVGAAISFIVWVRAYRKQPTT